MNNIPESLPWCLFQTGNGWHLNQKNGAEFIGSLLLYSHRAEECEVNASYIVTACNLF